MGTDEGTEKLSITLPKEVAEEVRKLAPSGGVSAFLTAAARAYLRWLKQREGLGKGYGAWSDVAHPELIKPQDTIRYVQSLREHWDQRALRVAEPSDN